VQKSKYISGYRKVIAYALLFLVTSLLFNNVAYLHTHITTGGESITHAHPYNTSSDSTPIKTHTHKKYEYSVIHSILFFLIASTLVLAIFNAKIHKNLIISKIHYSLIEARPNFLRGPPTYVIY